MVSALGGDADRRAVLSRTAQVVDGGGGAWVVAPAARRPGPIGASRASAPAGDASRDWGPPQHVPCPFQTSSTSAHSGHRGGGRRWRWRRSGRAPRIVDDARRGAAERRPGRRDGYLLDAHPQRLVVQAGHRLLFFDDNGHCGHHGHLVVNQNAHATPACTGSGRPIRPCSGPLRGPAAGVCRWRRWGPWRPGRPARIWSPWAGRPAPPGRGSPRHPAAAAGRRPGRPGRAATTPGPIWSRPRSRATRGPRWWRTRDMAHQLGQTRLVVSAAGTTTYERRSCASACCWPLRTTSSSARDARAGGRALPRCGRGGPTEPSARCRPWADGDALDAPSDAGRALVDGQGPGGVVRRMRGQARLAGAPLDLQRAAVDRGALWSQANDLVAPRPPTADPGSTTSRGCGATRASGLPGPPRAGLKRAPMWGRSADQRGETDWEISVVAAGSGAGAWARAHRRGRLALAAERAGRGGAGRIRADNAASLRSFAKAGFGAPRPTPWRVWTPGCWWRPGADAGPRPASAPSDARSPGRGSSSCWGARPGRLVGADVPAPRAADRPPSTTHPAARGAPGAVAVRCGARGGRPGAGPRPVDAPDPPGPPTPARWRQLGSGLRGDCWGCPGDRVRRAGRGGPGPEQALDQGGAARRRAPRARPLARPRPARLGDPDQVVRGPGPPWAGSRP